MRFAACLLMATLSSGPAMAAGCPWTLPPALAQRCADPAVAEDAERLARLEARVEADPAIRDVAALREASSAWARGLPDTCRGMEGDMASDCLLEAVGRRIEEVQANGGTGRADIAPGGISVGGLPLRLALQDPEEAGGPWDLLLGDAVVATELDGCADARVEARVSDGKGWEGAVVSWGSCTRHGIREGAAAWVTAGAPSAAAVGVLDGVRRLDASRAAVYVGRGDPAGVRLVLEASGLR